jgi:hypothetical protein
MKLAYGVTCRQTKKFTPSILLLNPVNGIVNPAFWIAWESKNRQQAIGVRVW